MNSIVYPSGSLTNAMTVVPCFIGPGSRVTWPPYSHDNRSRVLVTVTEEGESELSVRVIVLAQKLHPQCLRIKGNRLFKIPDANHCMQKPHINLRFE